MNVPPTRLGSTISCPGHALLLGTATTLAGVALAVPTISVSSALLTINCVVGTATVVGSYSMLR